MPEALRASAGPLDSTIGRVVKTEIPRDFREFSLNNTKFLELELRTIRSQLVCSPFINIFQHINTGLRDMIHCSRDPVHQTFGTD